jgi:hypothetical protein
LPLAGQSGFEFKPGTPQLCPCVKTAEVACHSLQDSANTEALLPSVCALSLIPRAGRKHMPQLLQPLMDDDSPVADVFDSCSICDQLTVENSQVSMVSALLLICMSQRTRGTDYKLWMASFRTFGQIWGVISVCRSNGHGWP